MANKNQSAERSKNINRRWFKLVKPLQRRLTISIDEQIRRAEVKLENLRNQKARGISIKPRVERIDSILGIPLVFNGHDNKTVALAAVRSRNKKKYDIQEQLFVGYLVKEDYMPTVCSVSMKGVC